jgi:hypothetical protein
MQSRLVCYHALPRAIGHALVCIGLGTTVQAQSLSFGSVVVFNDEWPLTNLGFKSAPDGAGRFIENFVGEMDPADGVSILVLSSNYAGEWASTFRERLISLGASVEISVNPLPTPAELLPFDGVVVVGRLPNGGPPDNQALIGYVQLGGNVLVLGGTLGPGGDAGLFNPLLRAFGLEFIGPNNNLTGTFQINSADPFFAGVAGLWQSNGNSIVKYGNNPNAQIFALTSPGEGLYAVSRLDLADCDGDLVPDLVEIRQGAADTDGNGIPDTCEIDPCPGDINESGVVNAVDISMILSSWGTSGGKFPRTDTNQDGIVDAQDLAVVLSGWGNCP